MGKYTGLHSTYIEINVTILMAKYTEPHSKYLEFNLTVFIDNTKNSINKKK